MRRTEAGRSGRVGPETYAAWRATALGGLVEARERSLVLELAGDIGGRRLLDVGCGDGSFAIAAARRGAAVVGVDPDARMRAAARRRADEAVAPVLLAGANAESLPFASGLFDVVVAVTVLCFVRDAGAAIAEMARVLKPGGRLVLGDLGGWSLWAARRRVRGWLGDGFWRAAHFRTAPELRRLVEYAGLDFVAARGAVFFPPWPPLALAMAPIDRRLGALTTFGAAFIGLRADKPSAGGKATTR
jgi:SAM-dependent methyltransferase